MRDSPLYIKSFDKRKVTMTHFNKIDDPVLDSIDEVRKRAKQAQDSKDPNWQQWNDSS
jgi:hypothetical protein